MMRSLLAVAAGYLSILFLNSFVHFIIAVYSKGAFALSGISELSSPVAYIVTAAGFLFGLIGGLLTCSIDEKRPAIAVLSLVILVITAGFFVYEFSSASEPLWYLISSPAMKVLGILGAFYIKERATNSTKPEPIL